MSLTNKKVLKMNFSGTFYPDNKNELNRYFDFFNNTLEKKSVNFDIKALIVPHAGYIYSGKIANQAYILAKNKKFKRAVVIGPAHSHYLKGLSVGLYDEYETPLGNLTIDKTYANEIIENYDFVSFDEDTHMEHSTETQIPFLKNYFPNIQIIEIVYGNIDFNAFSTLIKDILKNDENLLVVSSDLSHFYNQEEANILDTICLEAIKNMDIKKLDEGCEACGEIGIKALIKASNELGYKSLFLDYCTSYDVTKDSSSVVGYSSFLIGVDVGI